MPRYKFIGRPPRYFAIVFTLGAVNFFVTWILGMTRSLWAHQTPQGVFTYPMRFRGGETWYFPPALGWYLDVSFVAHFVALGVLGVIVYRHRARVVRVDTATSMRRADQQK